jgi:hypothetical protein
MTFHISANYECSEHSSLKTLTKLKRANLERPFVYLLGFKFAKCRGDFDK